MKLNASYLVKQNPLLHFKFDFYKGFVKYVWSQCNSRKLAIERCRNIFISTLKIEHENKTMSFFNQFIGLNTKIFNISVTPLIYLTLIKVSYNSLDDFFADNYAKEYTLKECLKKIYMYFIFMKIGLL